jgi:hypothetical protein
MSDRDLSIIIPAKASGAFIVPKVEVLLDYLQQHWHGPFEVVVCVNTWHQQARVRHFSRLF